VVVYIICGEDSGENSMKKIWLINHYAMPPELEPRLRTIKFAEYLTKSGYDVTIFGASSMHNMDLNLITGKEDYIEKQYGPLKFVHVRAKSYSNYFERVLNLIEFPIRLSKIAHKFEKPDIILQTATVPFGNILYFLAKNLKAKYFVEVLDLWPESFVMTGLVNKKNPIMPILYYFEKWLYKRADHIIFSMQGGKDYIVEKRWDISNGGPIDISKVSYINNGVDLEEFHNNLEAYSFEDIDLNDETTFKAIYLGSIRLFNNVKLIIEAAERLKEHKHIKFLIYGDGDERAMLERYVEDNKISNVVFKAKRIDKEFIPFLLSRSSVNLVNYQQNGLWNYGGSQSKMFQYLASGKPIISNIIPKYCVIRKNKCGISRTFANPDEYANAILEISNLNESNYKEMCSNAAQGALEFDYPFLTEKLISIIKN
jgi:glycosyltransferase involved in cell wall biosynthesis